MPRTCTNCSRALPEPDGGESPAFCMYCGYRLRDSPSEADSPTASFQPSESAELAATLPTPPGGNPSRPPVQVGGYQLIRSLGAGGMGAVFEAVAPDGVTHVALKLLGGKLANDPISIERFKQEGRVASQIVHPRCVFVIDADTDAGRPYIVMELMPGTTLKDVVDLNGPLPVPEAIARILDVIDGLAEAHRLGVIHRDVKPSNCFLTADDRVKVGDFGLSKSLTADREGAQLTQTGAFLGTVLFASPEQIRGEPVGYDSDVYSVSATLYFLLAGRAPHQHTSLTGVLAKAISEPPDPLRSLRSDVPASLDRVILRGLERDRARRWQTVEELRDALRDQLPATHTPARVRSLAVAYLADTLFLQAFVIPIQLVADPIGESRSYLSEWLSYAAALIYFGLAEGVSGTTAGKYLLRLRVARLGEVGPPGLKAAFLRTAIFNGLFFGAMTGFWMATDWELPGWERLVGLALIAAAAGAMGLQLRRTPAGYRGLHDLATGCHTLARPRPPERVRLLSRFPNPLAVAPKSPADLPPAVSGFSVLGKLCDLAGGGEVWLGEDKSLGRRVLIRVAAAGQRLAARGDPIAIRPSRLRVIGGGEFIWHGGTREWVASVAPAGCPLVDAIDPGAPLDWADARPILEQLTDELLAGAADGTAIERPGLSQLWVEAGGRLQLAEVPLPTGSGRAAEPDPERPLEFVRAVAALLMEGKPRRSAGRLNAPIPPHAAVLTDKLFADGPGGYSDLAELRADLTETHTHPPRVTRPMRAAHLWVQSGMLAVGLIAMFAAVGLPNWVPAVVSAARAWEAEELGRSGPAPSDWWALHEEYRGRLSRPERDALERFLRASRDGPEAARSNRRFHGRRGAERFDEPSGEELMGVERSMRGLAAAVVIGVPLVWAGFAFAFRGGLAMFLVGIAVIRADGRRAGRLRCAARELLVWLPVAGLLLACLWVQAIAPNVGWLRVGLWASAALLLPAYALLALRSPARTPHDRLLGTVLVPV